MGCTSVHQKENTMTLESLGFRLVETDDASYVIIACNGAGNIEQIKTGVSFTVNSGFNKLIVRPMNVLPLDCGQMYRVRAAISFMTAV